LGFLKNVPRGGTRFGTKNRLKVLVLANSSIMYLNVPCSRGI